MMTEDQQHSTELDTTLDELEPVRSFEELSLGQVLEHWLRNPRQTWQAVLDLASQPLPNASQLDEVFDGGASVSLETIPEIEAL
ncbi:MAG: hypothetical protein ACOYLB_03080, partial [Phototrophicaceae bacterium]